MSTSLDAPARSPSLKRPLLQALPLEGGRYVDNLALHKGAVVFTVAAALAFASVFVLRLGLRDEAKNIIAIFACAILPVWLSVASMRIYSASPLKAGTSATLSLFAGILFPLFGLIAGTYT